MTRWRDVPVLKGYLRALEEKYGVDTAFRIRKWRIRPMVELAVMGPRDVTSMALVDLRNLDPRPPHERPEVQVYRH